MGWLFLRKKKGKAVSVMFYPCLLVQLRFIGGRRGHWFNRSTEVEVMEDCRFVSIHGLLLLSQNH